MSSTTTSFDYTDVPLTTVFKQPPSCAGSIIINYYATDRGTALYGWGLPFEAESQTPNITRNYDCEPSGVKDLFDPGRQSGYSPGICPEGWATATSSYISGIMHAYCCMEGYQIIASLDESYYQISANLSDLAMCRGTITTAKVVTPVIRTDEYLIPTTKITVEPPLYVEHNALSVAWRPAELTTFPNTAMPTFNTDVAEESRVAQSLGLLDASNSRASGTGTSTDGRSEPTGDGITDSNVGGSSGLSTGAKIGIGVGAGLGGLILLAGLIYLLIRRRKAKSSQKDNGVGYGINNDTTGGIDSAEAVGGIAEYKQ